MTDLTTYLAPGRRVALFETLSALVNRMTQPPLPTLSDKAMRDAGITRAAETPPLAQDAATALHLMSLGQWY